MTKLGDIFMGGVSDSDPENTKKIATAFDTIMKSCSEEPLQSAVGSVRWLHPKTTRINEEILQLLNRKLQEMKPLLVASGRASHLGRDRAAEESQDGLRPLLLQAGADPEQGERRPEQGRSRRPSPRLVP